MIHKANIVYVIGWILIGIGYFNMYSYGIFVFIGFGLIMTTYIISNRKLIKKLLRIKRL